MFVIRGRESSFFFLLVLQSKLVTSNGSNSNLFLVFCLINCLKISLSFLLFLRLTSLVLERERKVGSCFHHSFSLVWLRLLSYAISLFCLFYIENQRSRFLINSFCNPFAGKRYSLPLRSKSKSGFHSKFRF